MSNRRLVIAGVVLVALVAALIVFEGSLLQLRGLSQTLHSLRTDGLHQQRTVSKLSTGFSAHEQAEAKQQLTVQKLQNAVTDLQTTLKKLQQEVHRVKATAQVAASTAQRAERQNKGTQPSRQHARKPARRIATKRAPPKDNKRKQLSYLNIIGPKNKEPDWRRFSAQRNVYAFSEKLRRLRFDRFGRTTWKRKEPFWLDVDGYQPFLDAKGNVIPPEKHTPIQRAKMKKIWGHVNTSIPIYVRGMTGTFFGGYDGKRKCKLPDGRDLTCEFIRRGDTRKIEPQGFYFHVLGKAPTKTVLPGQRLIHLTLESDGIYPGLRRSYDKANADFAANKENKQTPLLYSYRMDADIPHVYADVFKHLKEVPFNKKKKRGIYMQSSCRAHRDKYVKGVMKHFPIDAGGGCLHNTNMKAGRMQYLKNAELYSNYMFTFAFENSIADYYVTERLYHALAGGSVPVYMGAPNFELVTPPNSIIYAADYPDPKKLAEHLHKLSKNPRLYGEYQKWRKEKNYGQLFGRLLSLAQVEPQCRVCIKLAHKCNHDCPCGGRQIEYSKFYDGKEWKQSVWKDIQQPLPFMNY